MNLSLSYDWVTTPEGLDALRADWTRLAGERLGVFRTWEWQRSWWKELGSVGAGFRELRVLVARDRDGVRAILPMYAKDVLVAGLVPRRQLRFIADGVVGSDYLGLVADPGEIDAVAFEVARHLRRDPMLDDIDELRLVDLLDGDPLTAALRCELADAMPRIGVAARYRCAYARLSGSFDSYLAGRAKGMGQQYKRRLRWLQRQPGFELRLATTPQQVVSDLEHLFALHRLRWSPEGGSQAIPDERVERFHREAARRVAERGWVRLATVFVGGRAVASSYGFACGTGFSYYQGGLDPEWRQRSVGTVALGALVERAYAESATEFDFLRGDESYKRMWADHWRSTHAVHADRFGPLDRLAQKFDALELRARRHLGTRLPAPAVARLRGMFSQRLYG